MIRKILRIFVARTLQHPMYVLVTVGILTIFSIVSLFYLGIETNITTLLPSDSRFSRTLNRALKTFKTFDFLFVAIETDEPGQPELLIEAAETMAPNLDHPAYIYSVDYKFDPRLKDYYLNDAEEHLACLLNPEDLDAMLSRFSADTLEKQMIRLSRRLQVVISPATREKLLSDPLNFNRLIMNRLFVSRGPAHFPLRRDYFLSEDEKMLIMVLKPLESSSDLAFSTDLMNFLDRVRQKLIYENPRFKDKIRVSYMGSHVETVANTVVVRNDLILTLITSFIGVLLLFFLIFRNKQALVFVGIPLIVGILWTLGITQLAIGRLTMITFAFGAVLIGLGIDFAIHIYNRFIEEQARPRELSVYKALHTALVRTGEGVILGAVTTSAAFYAMAFTSFRGFRELGFVAGSGIICCLASIYLLFPLLVRFSARKSEQKKPLTMPSFRLPRLFQFVSQYPRLVIIAALVIMVYFAYNARFIQFDDDFSALKQSSPRYEQLRERMKSKFSLPSHQLIAIVSGSTIQDVLEKNDRLYENLTSQDRYDYLSCDTLRTFLPSIKTQRKTKKKVSDTIGERFGELKEKVLQEATQHGLTPKAMNPFIENLKELKQAADDEDNWIRFEDMKDRFIIRQTQRYLVKEESSSSAGDRYKVVTRIFPPAGSWRGGVPDDFLQTISRGVGDVEFTGVAVVANEIRELIKKDLARVMLLVIGSILLILMLYFRRVVKTVFAIIPVACGSICMLGTIYILGIDLNFLNVIVVPMIIGVGVDNGIHLMQRYYEIREKPLGGDLRRTVVRTGRALVMTSLTTMVGFGSLILADFRGIREMGLLSIFGIAYTLLASLVLLPALLKIWGKRRKFSDIIGREDGEIR